MDWQDGEQIRDATPKEVTNNTDSSSLSIDEGYDLLQRGEWSFMFTRIDAVYVWTRGGYQVGRNPDDYPVFLAIREQDSTDWETFFESIGLPVSYERQPSASVSGPLQVVLEPRSSLDIEYVEGYPVIPREETIAYMNEHYAHFQSALEMLDRMYDDLDLDVVYRETDRPQQ